MSDQKMPSETTPDTTSQKTPRIIAGALTSSASAVALTALTTGVAHADPNPDWANTAVAFINHVLSDRNIKTDVTAVEWSR
jgi:hypothetical protein